MYTAFPASLWLGIYPRKIFAYVGKEVRGSALFAMVTDEGQLKYHSRGDKTNVVHPH